MVNIYGNPLHEFTATCQRRPTGVSYMIQGTQEELTEETCKPGCVESKRDCDENEVCSKQGKCIPMPCLPPASINGNLHINGGNGCHVQQQYGFLGSVGCKGTFKCDKGHIYDANYPYKSKAVDVECFADTIGEWKVVDKYTKDVYPIMSCVKGKNDKKHPNYFDVKELLNEVRMQAV